MPIELKNFHSGDLNLLLPDQSAQKQDNKVSAQLFVIAMARFSLVCT